MKGDDKEALAKNEDYFFLKLLTEEQYRTNLELRKSFHHPPPLVSYTEEKVKPGDSFLEGDFFYDQKEGRKNIFHS